MLKEKGEKFNDLYHCVMKSVRIMVWQCIHPIIILRWIF